MRRETKLGLSLALGGLVIVLDTTITVVAVPVLVRVFDAPLATMQWVTTAYLLALVTTLPLAAWVGARVGIRNAYVGALLVFAAASAWAGLAHNPGELIAARVVQGLAGGLINPLNMVLGLRDVPARHRGRVASLLGLPVLVGPVVGPILAGWFIESVSWRAIFFLTVPPALLAAALVRRFARDDVPAERVPLDVSGTLLLVPGTVLVVFGVGQATEPPWIRVLAMIVGLVLVAAFVRRSMRRPDPLLHVRLLTDPVFAGALGVLALFGAAYFGSMLLIPTYVQITRGDSALIAGSLGIPAGLVTGLSLQLCTRLVDRVPPRRIVVSGLIVAATSAALGIAVLRTDTPYLVIALLGATLGAGAGAVLMPTMTVAMRDLTGPALASGSSIMGLSQQLASALGNAAITALFAGLVGWRTGGLGVDQVSRLPDAARAAIAGDLVTAQRLTQLATLAIILLALTLAVRRLGVRPPENETHTRPVPEPQRTHT